MKNPTHKRTPNFETSNESQLDHRDRTRGKGDNEEKVNWCRRADIEMNRIKQADTAGFEPALSTLQKKMTTALTLSAKETNLTEGP